MIRGFNTFAEFRRAFPQLQLDPSAKDENVFVTLTLPTEPELLAVHSDARCPSCGGPMSVVASDRRSNCGALLLRCSACFKDHFLFITSERTTSPDVCIFRMSPKRDSTQSLFDGFKCMQCNNPFQLDALDTGGYDIKTIIAIHMKCSSCRVCMNILFWDSPTNYYEHAIALGDAARPHAPEAAHVFYVAALENYLQKCFIAASDFNKFLVRSRKTGFQNLGEAKEVYREYFGIDLPALAGNTWQSLMDAVHVRNMIVHNAGHDMKFNPIRVTESDANSVRRQITDFVENALRLQTRQRMVD